MNELKKSSSFALMASLGAVTLLMLGAAPAHAAVDTPAATLDASATSALVQFWTEQGVSAEEQGDLLAGIEAGVLPQSIVGGAEPTAVVTTDETGAVTTTERWPDGSVAVSGTHVAYEFDDASGGVRARTIQNCDSSGGSGYQNRDNCNVSGTNGVVTLGFIASYTLVNGEYDQITNHHTPIAACAPATCSDPGFTQVVYNETAYSTAGITATTVYSAADYGSITHILNLIVGNDSASTSFSPLEQPS